ncbi:WD40-repeat-containing domain protein [Haematococcus lacustris]
MQPPGDVDEAGATTPGHQRLPFDVASAPTHCLLGHQEEVSALCLTPEAMYSGSWDNTVRVWSREEGENGPGFECVNVLRYDDQVGSVMARGGHLLVSAGAEVLVHDLGTGQVLRKFQNLHAGHVNCLEGSHSGCMLFTGSGDGLVLAHDLRMRDPTSTLWHFKAGVHSLALEDPWLACSTTDGGVVLLNTEVALGCSRGPEAAWTSGSGAGGRGAGGRHSLGASCRQLASAGSPAHSVDLVDQWLAAGSESTTVRVWDFSGTSDAAQMAAIDRAIWQSSKAERQASQMQRQQQQQQQQEEEVVEQEEGEEEVAVGMVELKLDASAVGVSQQARLGTSGPASSRSVESNPMPQPSTSRDGVLCAQLHLREAQGPVGAAAAILSRPRPTPAGLPQEIGGVEAEVSGYEELAAPEGQHWGARDHHGHATAHGPLGSQLLDSPPPRPTTCCRHHTDTTSCPARHPGKATPVRLCGRHSCLATAWTARASAQLQAGSVSPRPHPHALRSCPPKAGVGHAGRRQTPLTRWLPHYSASSLPTAIAACTTCPPKPGSSPRAAPAHPTA